MSAYDKYRYSTLPSPSFTRLVSLLTGAPNDELRCEIDTVDLESEPAYEAISYVWGLGENKPTIGILGRNGNVELEIPANLVAGLRRLRRPLSTRRLWADSICINQDDDEERSQQVRIMGRIYRAATTVLVWLGEEPDEWKIERPCSCMNLLKDAFPRREELQHGKFTGLHKNASELNSFLGITRPSPDDIHSALGIPLLVSPEFEALWKLFDNSWFSRAWTWQESLDMARELSCPQANFSLGIVVMAGWTIVDSFQITLKAR